MTLENIAKSIFAAPSIPLAGPVDYDMYRSFRDQLNAPKAEGLIVVELSTLGGDPEVARTMGEDVRRILSTRRRTDMFSWARQRSIPPVPHS